MGAIRYRGRAVAAGVMGVALAALAGPGVAQETEQVDIDEIVVTTRFREEALQQVPIAIDIVTAETLQNQGIRSLQGIVNQSSSLILDQGFAAQDQRIVVRGLSPTRGRQNVAVLQDGIDVSSEAIATAGGSLLINPRLFDLERVEVVKGPQVALYGRAAFNGAINYITRKPGDEFAAKVGTDIGSDGHLEFSGYVDGPVSETISLGLSGMTWNEDGYYTNSLTGQKVGGSKGTSIAGTALWDITDTVQAILRVENLNDDFDVSPYAVMAFNADFIIPTSAQVNPPGPLGPVISPTLGSVRGVQGDTPDAKDLQVAMSENPRTCDPDVPNTGNNGCSNYPGSSRDITRATLTLAWDAGPGRLTSLTHYADANTSSVEGSEDVSASTSPVPGEFWLSQDTSLFSEEIRWTSTPDGEPTWKGGGLSWVVGGNVWLESTDAKDGSFTCLNYTGALQGFPNGPQPCGPYLANIFPSAPLDVPGDGLTPLNADKWSRDTDSYSLYFLADFRFLDKWKLTFEGRQTWEDLTVKGPDEDNGLFDPSGTLCLFFSGFQGPPCPQTGPGTSAITGETVVADSLGGSDDDSFFAPKVTLTWLPTDNQTYYLSWAESFKPSGISALLGGTGGFFNPTCGTAQNPQCVDPIANFRFGQEKLDVYELGGKTQWLDRSLILNGAVFYQDFKNKQVSTQIADPLTGVLSPRILNAGEAEIWGVELDATWLATDNLSFNLSYTWLDTEYTDFVTFTTGAGAIAYAGNCTQTVVAGVNGCNVSYNGNELEGAPPNAVVGNARWQAPLAGATDYFVEGNFNYQDRRFVKDDNQLIFPSYWLFDFRVGISNDKWDALFYVDNAFDDDTVKSGFADGDIPTFYATNRFLNHGTLLMPDPRTYGLRVNYRFE